MTLLRWASVNRRRRRAAASSGDHDRAERSAPPNMFVISHATAPISPAAGIVNTQARGHLPRHAPVNAGQLLADPGAHHAAGDDMGGRERVAVVGGGEDHGGAGRFGREALRRFDRGDAVAHRVDDPPAADHRAGGDREGADELDPERHVEMAWADLPVGDQRQRDHAHRLLGVVGAVGQRDQRCRADLAVPVAAPRFVRFEQPDQPVGEKGSDGRDQQAISGDSTAGARTVCTSAWKSTALLPAAATVAPITPPISAWLELDGSVRYHVTRFQRIAPTSAARTISSPVFALDQARIARSPWRSWRRR